MNTCSFITFQNQSSQTKTSQRVASHGVQHIHWINQEVDSGNVESEIIYI